MAFTYKGCQGFEMRALEVFDVIQPTNLTQWWTDDTPGPWSRYAWIATSSAATNPGRWSIRQPALNGVWLSFAWKDNGAGHMTFWDDTGVTQISLTKLDSGLIAARRGGGGGTTLATTIRTVDANIWHSLQLYLDIADSNGRVILIVDGVNELDFTGDTRNGGSGNFFFVGGSVNDTGVLKLDDFIFGTGGPTDAPGVSKVWGSYPSGDGDVLELSKKPASVSRFYLPSRDGTGGVTSVNEALISPAPDAGWEHTSAMVRRALHAGKGLSFASGIGALTGGTESPAYSGVVANDDLLVAQFVSPPIAAQTISGTVKGQIQAREEGGADDERAQIVIRVVSNDGSTVRGTLLAMDTGALSSEFASSPSSWTNRRFPRGGAATMTSVVAQEGDRIVVEVGARHHGATVSATPSLRFGEDTNQDLDLPENETETSYDYIPWIEFSNAITLSTTVGNADLAREAASDGDATYLYHGTIDKRDLYAMENVSAFDSIVGVTLFARVRRNDAGPGLISLGVKSGGTESFGPDLPVALGYTVVQRDMAVDPTDSAAWTPSKVNALQAGWKTR